MSQRKVDKQIIAEISKYRAICLIHRYLYYVKASSMITDHQYDVFERKLKELVTQHPSLAFDADNQAYCPTVSVGSDNPEDYPRRIEQLAEDLWAHKGEHDQGKAAIPELSVLPSTDVSSGSTEQ